MTGECSSSLDDSLLVRKNIVTKSVLKTIFNGNGTVDEDNLDYICLFLRAYGLIFPIVTQGCEEDEQAQTPQFLVPCRLKELRSRCQKTPPLVVKRYFLFEIDFEGYLPEEVFVRFICLAGTESTSALHPPDCGKATYHLDKDYCNLDDWKENGDQWEIYRKGSTMQLFIK